MGAGYLRRGKLQGPCSPLQNFAALQSYMFVTKLGATEKMFPMGQGANKMKMLEQRLTNEIEEPSLGFPCL